MGPFEVLSARMELQLCNYSGLKIHPGHGKTFIRIDGKTYIFLNAKCEAAHLMKRNPREVPWTVLYRRKHKKGIEEESTKKKNPPCSKIPTCYCWCFSY